MKEPNNRTYEQQWISAFDNAEQMPSDVVWNNIELSIAKASNASNKKRILFFQLLVAASIAFATVVGSFVLYQSYFENTNTDLSGSEKFTEDASRKPDENEKLLLNNIDDKETIAKNDDKEEMVDRSTDTSNSNSDSAIESKNETNREVASKQGGDLRPSSLVQVETSDGEISSLSDTELAIINLNQSGELEDDRSVNSNLPGLVPGTMDERSLLERLGLDLGFNEVEPVELRMVPWYSFTNTKRKKTTSNQNMWTGLGLSAGSFNPNSGIGGTNETSALANDIPESFLADANNAEQVTIGEERPGNVVSIGVNFGKVISSKVVLISGLSYLRQTSTSFSNLTASGSVVSSFNQVSSFDQLDVTNRYEIENRYSSISIPLQAGYYLLNRKIGILLLAGFSNDFFLRRSVSDQSGILQSEQFDSDAEGYSLYTIGGLLGTQFSYQINKNYSIAIQPQFKQNLNSFAPNLNNPSTFELGFRFNYRLK